jgi:demethylmenaquinone methyltransferase/2-methoxy-6-polyprenyl-1,4-benzoquinol methylase
VLDLACGTGDLCRELERASMRPIGVDFSHGMLSASRTDVPLVQGDALRLPMPDASVDGVTCGFALRNFVDLDAFFVELARVTRPYGHIALLEVAEPRARVLRWGHGVYFGKVVPRVGALFSDGNAYRYLPKSVAYLPSADEMLASLRTAGFDDIERRLLSTGIAQLIVARRADER